MYVLFGALEYGAKTGRNGDHLGLLLTHKFNQSLLIHILIKTLFNNIYCHLQDIMDNDQNINGLFMWVCIIRERQT